MGIPIPTRPHSARKDRVGLTLGMFVQRNFLNRDVIAQRLTTLRPAERLATWLMEPASVKLVARQLARAVSAGANVLRDEDVDNLIGNALLNRIRETPVAPLLAEFLALLTTANRTRIADQSSASPPRVLLRYQSLSATARQERRWVSGLR